MKMNTTNKKSPSIPEPVADNWIVFIDGFDQSQVYGWAKRKDSDESQCIDVYIDGVCAAAQLNANIFRIDLQQNEIGHGRYGFSVHINDVAYTAGEAIQVAIHEAAGAAIASRTFTAQAIKDEYALRIDKLNSDKLTGWCVNQAKKWEVLELGLYVDGLFFRTLRTNLSRGDLKEKNVSAGQGGFQSASPLAYLRPGICSISFAFPDGSFSAEHSVTATGRAIPGINDLAFFQRPVTIIVPIYNAAEDLQRCIDKLLEHTLPTAEILLIDDCSPDIAVASILSRYAGYKQIRILRNKNNLGFTRTVNRGIIEAGDNDVILLNSDARVTPGWLQGMLRAASSAQKIATVTAMSDRAGAFSAPEIGNENMLPPGANEDGFARAFRRHSLGAYPRVPTGNGFCMFIRRACIKAIGMLDEEAFPRGYGEENDFCMRALRAGWQNIIDDRTYVFHERSKSFVRQRSNLKGKAG